MKISKNFYLKELLKSDIADRQGIDNSPGEEELASLIVVTHKVLQPIRDEHGVVTVTSGLRVLELNRLLKSSDHSQHVKGEAVDFECFSMDNKALAKWVEANLDFDQLILEFYREGVPNSGWVHCSFNRVGKNRKETKTFLVSKDGTEKIDGII